MTTLTDDYFHSTLARLRSDLDDLERCWLNNRHEVAPAAPTLHPSAQLLTAADVAKRFQVRHDTVYAWKSTGQLRAIGHGRGVRFRLSEVERFEREREKGRGS